MIKGYYTGVGARATPLDIIEKMWEWGALLARRGWVLRSGAAQGADEAWETGCFEEDGRCEIYLPWAGFGHYMSSEPEAYIQVGPSDKAIAEVRKLLGEQHWNNMTRGGRTLHSRNWHQVHGKDGSKPSSFVVCWTPRGEDVGGTRTAILLGRQIGIPVINLGNESQFKAFEKKMEDLKELLKKQ